MGGTAPTTATAAVDDNDDPWFKNNWSEEEPGGSDATTEYGAPPSEGRPNSDVDSADGTAHDAHGHSYDTDHTNGDLVPPWEVWLEPEDAQQWTMAEAKVGIFRSVARWFGSVKKKASARRPTLPPAASQGDGPDGLMISSSVPATG